jgi:DNA-directed RNA polymerase specialized sigma24 family protein
LLAQTATNVTLQELARRGRIAYAPLDADVHYTVEPESEFDDPTELPPLQQLHAQFETSLTDPLDREIYHRKFVVGQKTAVLAGDLGLTTDAVYQRIHRIKERLAATNLFREYRPG